MTNQDRVSILCNDLIMLIEAQECYNKEYYNSEYKRLVDIINSLGGF